MKVLIFSRGLGMGHISRDLELIKEFRRVVPGLNAVFCSYASGLEYLSRMNYKVFDLGVKATPAFWTTFTQSLVKAYKIIMREKPQLLISDEEFYVPVLGRMIGIPTCFVTNWFPSPEDILGLSCLEMADIIIFPDILGSIDVPPELTKKTVFVGPIISSSTMEKIKSLSDKGNLKQKLGYCSDQHIILVTRGRMWTDPEFMNTCAKSLEIVRRNFPETVMVIISGKEISKEKVLEGVMCVEAISVVEFVEDLLSYMAASDIVVTEGYTTLWEAAAIGLPIIAVTFLQHLEQERLAKAMQNRGVAIWIPRSKLSVETLAKKFIWILSDETLAKKMSKAGIELCRESGARKTVEVILNTLKISS
jgi:UDP-N-acetylglucosamine:LPS N-acetylglucosamine transferase